MAEKKTPDEKPKRDVAKQVVTSKRQYFVPKYGRTVEAESAEEAGKLAAKEVKTEEEGDA